MIRSLSVGGLEQSEPREEVEGESQRSDSGPEEDPRLGATETPRPAENHKGRLQLTSGHSCMFPTACWKFPNEYWKAPVVQLTF